MHHGIVSFHIETKREIIYDLQYITLVNNLTAASLNVVFQLVQASIHNVCDLLYLRYIVLLFF